MRKIKKLTALMLCALLMLTLCPIALAAGNSVKIDQKTAAGSEMIIDFGDDPQLTATVTVNGQTSPLGLVDWSSSDPAVAGIDKLGNVTTAGVGQTTITASFTDATGTASDTMKLTVRPKVTVPSTSGVCVGGKRELTATVEPNGTYLYSWSSGTQSAATVTTNANPATVIGVAQGTSEVSVTAMANNITSSEEACTVTVYPAVTGVHIEDSTGTTVTKTVPGQLSCVTEPDKTSISGGTAEWKSSNSAVAAVDDKGLVTGKSSGTATISCTFSDGVNTKTASCTVDVTYNTAKSGGTTSVSAPYGKETSMSGAYSDIYQKYNTNYSAAPAADASINFYSISGACGSLHGTSGTVAEGTSYRFADLKNMAFTPSSVGEETLYYTLYSYPEQMNGTIVITVTSTSSLVTVNLDNSKPYTFSTVTVKDNASASSKIYEAVYGACGKAYSYIIFGAENTAAGALYTKSGGSQIGTADKIYYTGSGNTTDSLYFIPAGTGTYSRSFTAYGADGGKLAACALYISVPDNAAASADIYYTTPISSELKFDESDFISWFRSQSALSNYLSYVKFTGAEYSNASYKGYFQHGTQAVTVGDGTNYCTGTYTGANAAGTYLSKVSYNSPIVQSSVAVSFTCYGGAAKNSTDVTREGKLFISVTNGTVGDITYSVSYGTDCALQPGDFVSAYCDAMNVSSAPSFYVKFGSTPAMGTMFVAGTGTSTAINDANRTSYSFRVNYNGTGNGIGDVTYIPGDRSAGTDSIEYAAYSTSGKLEYVGMLSFKYTSSSGTVSCRSDGYVFSVNDFYKSTDADPIYSVTFEQPASGRLYLNYEAGSGTQVGPSMRFYTKYSAYGDYYVGNVTYIPSEGDSGTVTIYYSGTTAQNKTSRNAMTINVVSKTASSVFSDVTAANTGTWSANSVDYAYRWGLVTGTGGSKFSPTVNMQRGMLVEVLYRAAGSPLVYGSCPFSDVKASDYYYRAVIWAYDNDIVKGGSGGKFLPKNAVTREQIAAILYNYAKYSGQSTAYGGSLSGYSDAASVDAYAAGGMSWCVYNGIITGVGGNRLNPLGGASRAQVAVMLHRFLTK
jgi:hypothetical protein